MARCAYRGPALSATVDFIGLAGLLPEPEPTPNGNGEDGNGGEPEPEPVRGQAWRWSMKDRVWTARAPAATNAELLGYIAALEKRVAELEAAEPAPPEPEPPEPDPSPGTP